MIREKIKKIFALIFPNRHLNRSLRILIVTNSIFVFIMGLFAPYYAVFIQNRGGVFVSYAFMTSLPQLILTQIIWGIAVALGTPAFDSVYASHTNKESSIAQWGNWESMAAISTGVAALIGGLVIHFFGFQVVFIAMATISATLGVYIWRLPREVL